MTTYVSFLVAFAKLRKAIISFVMSVRPSVRPSFLPSVRPSFRPSFRPSVFPSVRLSFRPSALSCPSFRPSVCPYGTTWLPLDGFS